MEQKTCRRSEALDALRGLAILMMVLSGAIPFNGALPSWMYHAQMPPPEHIFRPDVPGISWVDLVFPFFLFSMGAAIPFAISSRAKRGETTAKLLWHIVWRWLGLAMFAFFVYNVRPWVIEEEHCTKWIICLIAFLSLFAAYAKLPYSKLQPYEKHIHILGYASLLILIISLQLSGLIYVTVESFDIIIMILSCASLAGGMVWMAAKGSDRFLLGTWFLVTSFYMGSKLTDSWITQTWNYSPIPWFISWEYLKYLIILIPGMWAGNKLNSFYRSADSPPQEYNQKCNKAFSWLIAFLAISINIFIIYSLFIRALVLTFMVSLAGLLIILVITSKWNTTIKPIILTYLNVATMLIVSGLLLEPLQCGIKKDPATISYLMLTPGMALLMLISFIIFIDLKGKQKSFFLLTGSGKNAMFAYFAGGNLVMPVFVLTGINSLFIQSSYQAFWLTVKAIMITLLVAWLSAWMSRKRFIIKV